MIEQGSKYYRTGRRLYINTLPGEHMLKDVL